MSSLFSVFVWTGISKLSVDFFLLGFCAILKSSDTNFVHYEENMYNVTYHYIFQDSNLNCDLDLVLSIPKNKKEAIDFFYTRIIESTQNH